MPTDNELVAKIAGGKAVDMRWPLFSPGHFRATPGAVDAIDEGTESATLTRLLNRHLAGDWGDVDEHDKLANDCSVLDGTRIVSAYQLETGVRVLVITEADRSVTTILLPEEY